MTVILDERAHGHAVWSDDYCLRHCEGYRVVGPEGTVGYVEEVRLSPDARAEALVVRTRGYALLDVPADLVVEIDPEADCLRVAGRFR